jgi:predicted DsbA family dithiol-disulfide isomerase
LAELQAKHDVTLHWLPYELRPEPEPLPRMEGSDLERFRGNWERGVAPLAERYGLEMHFPPYKPRSRWAHEAAEFARDRDQFDAMRSALFQTFFVANRNIGEIEVLSDVAAGLGLDGQELRAALDEGRYTQRVRELEAISWQLGVRAVPTMVFGDTVAVEGAQPYEVLQRAIEVAEREAAEQPAAEREATEQPAAET